VTVAVVLGHRLAFMELTVFEFWPPRQLACWIITGVLLQSRTIVRDWRRAQHGQCSLSRRTSYQIAVPLFIWTNCCVTTIRDYGKEIFRLYLMVQTRNILSLKCDQMEMLIKDYIKKLSCN
jgi:hypothetical protein